MKKQDNDMCQVSFRIDVKSRWKLKQLMNEKKTTVQDFFEQLTIDMLEKQKEQNEQK